MRKPRRRGLVWWGAILVAHLASPASSEALRLEGNCRFTQPRGCECFLSSIETPLSFGEAAGTVELYYRQHPDERLEALLLRLFQGCSAPLQWTSKRTISPSPIITQDAMAPQPNSLSPVPLRR